MSGRADSTNMSENPLNQFYDNFEASQLGANVTNYIEYLGEGKEEKQSSVNIRRLDLISNLER